MKFLHLADLHFGKSVSGFSMLEDQRYILEQIYSLIQKEHIDSVLMAGDIYDRSIPGAEAVTLFDDFLTELKKLKVSVFMISGNHDSGERLNFAGRLLEEQRIYLSCQIRESIKKVTLYDEYGPVNIYMLPFLKPMTVRAFYGDDNIHTFEDGVRACLDHTKIDERERNLLMTHHFVVSGGEKPEISDSEMLLSVGGIDEVNASCFKAFDYTALGHIHRPQRIGSDYVRYAGSILKYSFSEAGTDKVLTVVEMKEKGSINIQLFKLVPKRDMRKIKGTLKALTDKDILAMADREDYIHVTLTDKETLLEPMNDLRSVYPNIMQLVFERNALDTPENTLTPKAARKPKIELFDEFYEFVTGKAMSGDERQLMEEIIDEAEKVNA